MVAIEKQPIGLTGEADAADVALLSGDRPWVELLVVEPDVVPYHLALFVRRYFSRLRRIYSAIAVVINA